MSTELASMTQSAAIYFVATRNHQLLSKPMESMRTGVPKTTMPKSNVVGGSDKGMKTWLTKWVEIT